MVFAGKTSLVIMVVLPNAPAIENKISFSFKRERDNFSSHTLSIKANLVLSINPFSKIASILIKLMPLLVNWKPNDVGVVPFVISSTSSPNLNNSHLLSIILFFFGIKDSDLLKSFLEKSNKSTKLILLINGCNKSGISKSLFKKFC